MAVLSAQLGFPSFAMCSPKLVILVGPTYNLACSQQLVRCLESFRSGVRNNKFPHLWERDEQIAHYEASVDTQGGNVTASRASQV